MANNLTDSDLAALVATAAGKILVAMSKGKLIDGAALGKAGDQTVNQFLCHILAHQRPEDGLLSEESKDTKDRLSKSRVWIIDPVDGTREYGEGRTDWAVHVGLSVNGYPKLGAVALPSLDITFRSDQPTLLPPCTQKMRIVVSRTRPPKEALKVAKHFDAELIPMGSAGAKAMAIVRGEADLYLHSGGQYEWDSCAPAAVAFAHGLHCSRINGDPLVYNQENPYLPDLVICRPEYIDLVRKTLWDR